MINLKMIFKVITSILLLGVLYSCNTTTKEKEVQEKHGKKKIFMLQIGLKNYLKKKKIKSNINEASFDTIKRTFKIGDISGIYKAVEKSKEYPAGYKYE